MTVTPTFTAETLVNNGDYFTWGTKIKTYFGQIIADIAALATQVNTNTTGISTNGSAIAALQTFQDAAVHTGDLKFGLYTTAPTGWVKCNGGSIGNASSGATTRANADTSALFTLIWTNTATADCAIQDSAGAGTTKGASAAADFAANKRLVLPDMRANFIRGLDDGRGVDTARAMASYAADTVGAHYHSVSPTAASGEGGQGGTTTGTAGGGESITPYNTGSTGTESAPKNIAALAVIKL